MMYYRFTLIFYDNLKDIIKIKLRSFDLNVSYTLRLFKYP